MLQRPGFNLYFALVILVLLLSPSLGQVTGKCEKCRFGLSNNLQQKCAQQSKPGLECKLNECTPSYAIPAARAIDFEDSVSGRQIVGLAPISGSLSGFIGYQCCCEKKKPLPSTCNLAAICYAVDESVFVGYQGFEKQKKFVLGTAKEIHSNHGSSVRYSMVEFNAFAFLTQSLTLYDEFVERVKDALFQGSPGNSVIRGLTECYEDMRDQFVGKNRVIVLLNVATGLSPATNIVQRIKQEKIGIMTIGIGNLVNEQYLKEVATTPNYYFPTTFNKIENTSQKAVARICNLVNSGVINQIAKDQTPKEDQNDPNIGISP